VRFYVTQQRGMGDRYVHGARSRFLTDAVLAQFDRISAQGDDAAQAGNSRAEPNPRIDIATRLRDMW
jgi:DNA helicase-2/ATP-dependent DNA helicase PcrA